MSETIRYLHKDGNWYTYTSSLHGYKDETILSQMFKGYIDIGIVKEWFFVFSEGNDC